MYSVSSKDWRWGKRGSKEPLYLGGFQFFGNGPVRDRLVEKRMTLVMAAPNLVALRAWMGRGDDGIISRTDVGILGQRAPHPQGDSVRQGVWMLLFVVVVVVVTMFMDRKPSGVQVDR